MVNNANKVAMKSGIWFTISNFIMKSIGFITTPIFTRLLTKVEFGDFNNFQTWMMIIMYITSLNLEGSLIRASKEFKDDLNSYTFSMFALSISSTAMWFLIINIFSNFFVSITTINIFYLNAMFLYLAFNPIINLFQNMERFKYNYKLTVLTSMFVSIGSSVLSVILVIFMEDKLFGRVIGYILPSFILGIIIILYFVRLKVKVKIKYWRYALPIVLPYIPHLLSMYLLNSVDKVMIKSICGSEMLALYSLAYTCGMLITILVNSVNNAYSPWLADKLSIKEYDKIHSFSKYYVAIFCVFSICAVLITPEILFVLGGESYMSAKSVLPPVAAGCLIQFVYCMYVNIEQYEKKTIGMAFASVIAAIINYVLNLVLIPVFGYIVAAYTTLIGYLVLLVMHMIFVKKLNMLHVYDNYKIVKMTLLATILVCLTTFIMDSVIVRYSLLILILLVIIFIVYKNISVIKSKFGRID